MKTRTPRMRSGAARCRAHTNDDSPNLNTPARSDKIQHHHLIADNKRALLASASPGVLARLDALSRRSRVRRP